ncbi:MAG: DUF1566 domain-containing protein [Gammaproteobacteria bacterium]|nr:DUF1566 domain-containing protein [Gammaproteobacteria bacterium]
MTLFFRCFFAILLGFITSVNSPFVMAQNCNSKIPATSSTQRFHDNQDGSITDQQTGLQWSRCSLGQRWEDNTCQNEARALPYAIVALITEEGWRLPSISELSSLVELQCSKPAINTTIFPATASAVYWTATRFISRDGYFWQVHFLHGEAIPEKVDSVAYVRWVRHP